MVAHGQQAVLQLRQVVASAAHPNKMARETAQQAPPPGPAQEEEK